MIGKTLLLAFMAVAVLADLNVSDEQQQQLKDLLKEHCKKNGAEDKSDQAETAIRSFVTCLDQLFDPDTIKREVEEAKPKGSLDEVFKKYCQKTPQLKTCIQSVLDGVAPCLEQKVSERIPDIRNGTDQLIDFVCYREGDRIAMFIAEGGPECLKNQTTTVRECATKLKDSISSVDAAKNLSLDEQCAKYDELSSCVAKALEDCSSPTPSNMAESLFRFVRKGLPCKAKN